MIDPRAHRAFFRAAILALLALASSCRGGERAPAPAASAPAPENGEASDEVRSVYPVDDRAAHPLARRLCEALHGLPQQRRAACCSSPVQGDLTAECTRVLTYALSDGSVSIDPGAVDRCASASSAALAGCEWVTPRSPSVPSACQGLIEGKLPAGKRCRSSLECSSGSYCQGLGPTQPGVCAPTGAVGARCEKTVDTLASYARERLDDPRHRDCDGLCDRGQCIALSAPGGACNSSAQCGSGRDCVDGACTKGEPCACGAGAACVRGECVRLKKTGEPCTSPFECEAACLRVEGSTTGQCGMQCNLWTQPGVPLLPSHAKPLR